MTHLHYLPALGPKTAILQTTQIPQILQMMIKKREKKIYSQQGKLSFTKAKLTKPLSHQAKLRTRTKIKLSDTVSDQW